MNEFTLLDFIQKLNPDRDIEGDSITWANQMSKLSIKTCQPCAEQHGKIEDISIMNSETEINNHPNCQCKYTPMRTKRVGTATDWGVDGADSHLYHHGTLPDYYVTKEAAWLAGWKTSSKKLSNVLPGKMIGGDEYANSDSKLPSAVGRIWYEADINYDGSKKRNRQRLLYSNDGLMFVSYDHYHTFYEILT